jgi:acylphosphatase
MDSNGARGNMAAAGIEARRVLYSGRVQGVGFRYTAHSIAQQHAVTGFVKNLRDGRVELVAEGTREELDKLLQEIAAAMDGNIELTDVQAVPVSARFRSFEVTS